MSGLLRAVGDKLPLLPFLKWAGGKRWIADEIRNKIPANVSCYFEPFLGGGAVFFACRPDFAVLSDTNIDLIETYAAIKKDWESVWDRLNWHQSKHSENHYYLQRGKKPRLPANKAARFIYLNRTCYNGLYRVNLRGVFNVPKGTKDRVIFQFDDFEAVSRSLQQATLKSEDFAATVDRAGRGDVVFLDPPYTVKHNCNGFVKYNEKLFNWDDQLRLRECAVDAALRGAKVILTNANHSSIKELYRGAATQYVVSRSSVLSGDRRYRGATTELVICL